MTKNYVLKREPASGRFVDYDKSGAVSVRVLDFLRSDAGKDQLKTAREMRDHSHAAGTTLPNPRPRSR